MTPEEYKKLSIKEFTQAAKIYDSGHAGIYEMCKDDYPPILAELEKEDFHDVLDCGCGTGPMIELLHEKYPEKHYVGLDLTPEMINVAQAKKLSNTEFLVGDSENLPFAEKSFDTVICSNSFHTILIRRTFSIAHIVFCEKVVVWFCVTIPLRIL